MVVKIDALIGIQISVKAGDCGKRCTAVRGILIESMYPDMLSWNRWLGKEYSLPLSVRRTEAERIPGFVHVVA